MTIRTLVITESNLEWPNNCLKAEVVYPNAREMYIALNDWRNRKPYGGADFTSLGMCGVELSRVSSNEELTLEQVIYLISRLRGDVVEPDDSRICMWQSKHGAILAIGSEIMQLKDVQDFAAFRQWVDVTLQAEFE